MASGRLFLCLIKAPVPPSRPGNAAMASPGRVKSAVFGGTGATRSPHLGASMGGPTIWHGLARPPCWIQNVVAARSVTPVTKGRLNRGDGVQIKIDDLLKRIHGGAPGVRRWSARARLPDHVLWAWLFSLRNNGQRDQTAALKRSSYRIANWFIASFQ